MKLKSKDLEKLICITALELKKSEDALAETVTSEEHQQYYKLIYKPLEDLHNKLLSKYKKLYK